MGDEVAGQLDDSRGAKYRFLSCLNADSKEAKPDFGHQRCNGGVDL